MAGYWVRDDQTGEFHGPIDGENFAMAKAEAVARDSRHDTSVWTGKSKPEQPTGYYAEPPQGNGFPDR